MASPAERLFVHRHVDPDAVLAPTGFRIEVAATGLNNPSSVGFDARGNIYVTEMSSATGSAQSSGRLVHINSEGMSEVVADDFVGALTGITYYEGAFYILESSHTSRVYMIYEDGTRDIILDGLPGGGDHGATDIVLARSERLYFANGSRTNSGVVGLDNSWLTEHPELCDVPASQIILAGKNFETANPFGGGAMITGAFKPFGVPSHEGELVDGKTLCTGGILRVDPEFGEPEVFAWGFGNVRGLSVHPDGRIFCTEIGMTARGSRPVADGRGYVWWLQENNWYGWPDFAGGKPVTDMAFKTEDGRRPEFVLKDHPEMRQTPVVTFASGSGVSKFDFSRSPFFGLDDVAFVALAGETGTADGSKIVAVDIGTGEMWDFIANKHPGPASAHHSGGLERPVCVRFDRTGEYMYVVDAGITDEAGHIMNNTGVLWRVSPSVLA